MRVAVDARHLVAGRGVARHLRRTLEASPRDLEWRAVLPGHDPVAPIDGITLARTRVPSRPLHASAALSGHPTLAALAGGADVAWIPAPAPVAVGVPYVLTIHDLSWLQRPQDFTPYERAWHRAARIPRLARRAQVVLADSHATAAEVGARFGVAARVSPPGVDRPPAGVVPHPGDYLLFVGALEPRKAPGMLIEAYARSGIASELLIAGAGGRLEPALRRDAPHGVRFVDVRDDAGLHALYAGARALVLPSHLEGFGFPPLEAAMHGTPSIVSDLPVFHETLGDGALFVPPGDVDAWAQALRETPPAPTASPRTWEQSAADLVEALRA